MQPLRVGGNRRDVGRHVQLELELTRPGPWPDDSNLLFQLTAQIDGGDVDRYRSRLDSSQVEQLLCHPQHALRLFMHDGCRARAFEVGDQTAVDERLAEADEAGQRGLEFMRDIGQEFSLHLARPLYRFGHAIERSSERSDLVSSTNADAPGIVPVR